MGNLRVESQQLHGLAKKVASTADDFKSSLDKVINYNNDLKSIWKGSDIDSYSAKVSEQAEEMNRFYRTLTEISTFMDKTATDYETAQETNESMIHR